MHLAVVFSLEQDIVIQRSNVLEGTVQNVCRFGKKRRGDALVIDNVLATPAPSRVTSVGNDEVRTCPKSLGHICFGVASIRGTQLWLSSYLAEGICRNKQSLLETQVSHI